MQQRSLDRLDEGYGLIPVAPVGGIGAVEGMPFTGPSGLLVDYSSFITDRPVFDNLVTTHVLAREGTPASVTEALSEAGLSIGTTLAQERQVLDQSAYALALRLYGVVAALVLLMALAGLFVSAAVQLPARRRDAAALRVVGVPKAAVMVAVVRELAVVLGSAALAGILAGSLAQWVVLRTITLGYADDADDARAGRGHLAAAAGRPRAARRGRVRGGGAPQRVDDRARRARRDAAGVGPLSAGWPPVGLRGSRGRSGSRRRGSCGSTGCRRPRDAACAAGWPGARRRRGCCRGRTRSTTRPA